MSVSPFVVPFYLRLWPHYARIRFLTDPGDFDLLRPILGGGRPNLPRTGTVGELKTKDGSIDTLLCKHNKIRWVRHRVKMSSRSSESCGSIRNNIGYTNTRTRKGYIVHSSGSPLLRFVVRVPMSPSWFLGSIPRTEVLGTSTTVRYILWRFVNDQFT